jgi:hypothetical protein
MNHRRIAMLCVSALLLGLHPFAGIVFAQTAASENATQLETSSASPNPKYGDGTPEFAIQSFYTALAMADRDTVEYILANSKELTDWIDAQLDITYAFHRFSEAAKAQFGDEGRSLYLPSPALLALKQLKEIKPVESGNTAEWATNPRLPTKLFRKDGHWKIDILHSLEKPEHLQELTQEFIKTASYIDAIAEEMENRRYATVQDVRDEMKKRRANSNSPGR